MTSVTFEAELKPSGMGAGGHLVEVPGKAVEALGGRGRVPVTATLNGVPYRGSIVTMGGIAMIGVTKAIMEEAGVAVGDTLTVVVEKRRPATRGRGADGARHGVSNAQEGSRVLRLPLVHPPTGIRRLHRRGDATRVEETALERTIGTLLELADARKR